MRLRAPCRMLLFSCVHLLARLIVPHWHDVRCDWAHHSPPPPDAQHPLSAAWTWRVKATGAASPSPPSQALLPLVCPPPPQPDAPRLPPEPPLLPPHLQRPRQRSACPVPRPRPLSLDHGATTATFCLRGQYRGRCRWRRCQTLAQGASCWVRLRRVGDWFPGLHSVAVRSLGVAILLDFCCDAS